ncbi:peptidase M1, alanyl aminopeptidase, partial [Baffinella frigidus]
MRRGVDFVLEGVTEEPVLSLLRGFSAPVKLEIERSEEELAFLMANDSDPFNKWEAGQEIERSGEELAFQANDSDPFNKWEAGQMLFQRTLLANTKASQEGKDMAVSDLLVKAVGAILADTTADPSLRAVSLGLPSLATLGEAVETIDPDALVAALKFTKSAIAAALRPEFEAAYAAATLPATGPILDPLTAAYAAATLPATPFRNDAEAVATLTATPFRNGAEAVGKRRIKNTCLDFLSSLKDAETIQMCLDQALTAGSMTDRVAATAQLAGSADDAARTTALDDFYEKHAKGNDLILCKYFTMQAMADTDDALAKADKLLTHPDFSMKNPNKCRSLIGAFAGNTRHFHAKDGSGYA